MGTPVSNGLFEVAGGKQPKERGFNCMQLIMFLTDEIREATTLGSIGTGDILRRARGVVPIGANALCTLGQWRNEDKNLHYLMI